MLLRPTLTFRFNCGCAETAPIPGELSREMLSSGEHVCVAHGSVRLTVIVNTPPAPPEE